ncbi:2,3-dihydroxybiphenyl 1,2-dioxygenase [Roseiarcus fermentans]|uniref:2,3-dihydroxybiphenyl 1,2-dioxygenase n=1 Tax=Roseiarcus fermentans TaxID=1473586 RepID=A0A366FHJ4_9HYPH|nr:VOC family protein [Roseiarcus fermentans]RBP14071.1 2,3-dihydroxybiphenyl 1,2-dioxygenase [Roseiarcus fermentans]
MNAIDIRPATTSVYGAVQFGYLLVESPRLGKWKRFAAEGIGMAIAEDAPGLLAFRTDGHARRLVVRKRDREDLALGWQIASPDALDLILRRLSDRGVAVEAVAGDEAALRGVARYWRFLGPKRQIYELFVEAKRSDEAPKVLGRGFVTGERGLGHVAISTRRPDAMIAFWREIFDAKISDFIEDRVGGVNLRIAFLRVNPRHHSIAVAATVGLAMDPFATKIQHVEMQAASLDDVGAAYRRCRALGVKIAMAVGQHPNDRDVSFYAVSPSGFYFELGWSAAEGEDIESWPQTTHRGISVWGHKPQDQTLGDKLAQVRNGLTSLFRKEYSPLQG